MRWTIKLEASTEWGDTQTFEIGRLARRVAGLASHEVGLTLDEAKELLAELQRRIVQTQIDETVFAARVCSDCLSVRPIRNRRTRVLQTLFGTVRVAAPRIKICACVMRWSPRGAHRVAVVRAAVLDGRLMLERALSEAA